MQNEQHLPALSFGYGMVIAWFEHATARNNRSFQIIFHMWQANDFRIDVSWWAHLLLGDALLERSLTRNAGKQFIYIYIHIKKDANAQPFRRELGLKCRCQEWMTKNQGDKFIPNKGQLNQLNRIIQLTLQDNSPIGNLVPSLTGIPWCY